MRSLNRSQGKPSSLNESFISTITIPGAIRTTGNGIASLRKVRDAPKDLARLLRELHDVLLQIYPVADGIGIEAANHQDVYRCGTIDWIKEQVVKADKAMMERDRLGQIRVETSDAG